MVTPILNRQESCFEIVCGNGCVLTFACQAGVVGGIGRVELDGAPLRSTAECIWPQIATPDGLEVDHYQLLDARVEGDAVIIDTCPWWRTAHRMEWQEHGGHQRISTTSWSKGCWAGKDHRLTWIIRPSNKVLGERSYRGFSYAFNWNAPGAAIYQIEDKATWEVGGRATGNTWIMRSAHACPVQTLEPGGDYTTGWVMPGITNPHIFQHFPLYTSLSGFTFQYDDSMALVTTHERPSHVRSLFHQDGQRDLLLHFNQFVFDLTDHVELPARHVLAAPVDSDAADLKNHYLAVRDQLQTAIRAHYGARHHRARPAGTVECWDPAKLDRFPAALEWLHEQGFRQIFVMPLWRSNETDVKPALFSNSQQAKQWGVVGNMCCVLEPEISDSYGGWPALQAAFEPARRLALECYAWYSNCFSSFSPLSKSIPDLFAHDQSGQLSRNNYGHVLFAVNNRSNGHLELFKATMRKLHQAGIRGVLRDSHFNMGTDTIDYRVGGDAGHGSITADQVDALHSAEGLLKPVIYSMHDAETQQMRFCQQDLDWLYVVESSGVLGLPRCGLSLDVVHNHEWLYDDMSTQHMSHDGLRRVGTDVVDAYFRGMANRLFYTVAVDPNTFPDPKALNASDWYDTAAIKPLNDAFLAVEPDLDHRRVLPDNQGIVWTSEDGAEVVFAYRNFEYPLEQEAVIEDVLAGVCRTADRDIKCHRHGIYRIRASASPRRISSLAPQSVKSRSVSTCP